MSEDVLEPPPSSVLHTAPRLALLYYFDEASTVVVWLGSRRKLTLAGDVGIQVLCWVREGFL